MIVLDKAALTVSAYRQRRTILSPTNLVIPSDRRIALLGLSNEERRILVNLLGGLIRPSAGRVVRRAKVSFPVGYLGGFDPTLKVRSNVAYLARLYDADVKSTVDFVESSAGLGSAFDKPYGLLAGDVKSYLGRIAAYSIPFDLYVLESQFASDKNDISCAMFEARSRTAGMIIPTRSEKFAREHCDMGMVLKSGQLQLYDHVEDALEVMRAVNNVRPNNPKAARDRPARQPRARDADL